MFTDANGAIVATFSFNVKARGKVSVKGRFANGQKTSANTQLMISDDGSEASVAIKGSKKIPFSAVVWFGKDGAVTVESITTSVANGVKCDVAGTAGGLSVGNYVFQTGNLELATSFNGKKFAAGDPKVTYKALTGEFTGNYKEHYTDARGKAKTRKVNIGGVFIDGVGYGMTKPGAFVSITPVAK